MLRDFPDCIWAWNVMICSTHHAQRRRGFEGDLRVTWEPIREEGEKNPTNFHLRDLLQCGPPFLCCSDLSCVCFLSASLN